MRRHKDFRKLYLDTNLSGLFRGCGAPRVPPFPRKKLQFFKKNMFEELIFRFFLCGLSLLQVREGHKNRSRKFKHLFRGFVCFPNILAYFRSGQFIKTMLTYLNIIFSETVKRF